MSGLKTGLPARARSRDLRWWIALPVLVIAAVAGTIVVYSAVATTPRDASFAQEQCLSYAVSQTTMPSSTRFANVKVAEAWDKKSLEPVIEEWFAHASAADKRSYGSIAGPFMKADLTGFAINTFAVAASVTDRTGSRVVLCLIGVDGSTATKAPRELLTTRG